MALLIRSPTPFPQTLRLQVRPLLSPEGIAVGPVGRSGVLVGSNPTHHTPILNLHRKPRMEGAGVGGLHV